MDTKAENCWDFWRCSESEKKTCAAHQAGAGCNCWMLAKNLHPMKPRDFQGCWQCPWFHHSTPDLTFH